MGIYGESLPPSYQRDIASLFGHSAAAMVDYSIPAVLAEDWLIVTGYLRYASEAITAWLESESDHPPPQAADGLPIDDRTPMVIRFDRLASLASHEGACRLERAAVAVQRYVGAPSALVLGDEQRRLLRGVASGANRLGPVCFAVSRSFEVHTRLLDYQESQLLGPVVVGHRHHHRATPRRHSEASGALAQTGSWEMRGQ